MSEDLVNAENAYADVKKRNEKLKLIINEHKAVELKKNKFFVWNEKTNRMKTLNLFVTEHRNIETFLWRIGSLYWRAETKICRFKATRSRKAERVKRKTKIIFASKFEMKFFGKL